MNIRRVLTAAVLATGIAAFAGPAFAGPIMGSIDVSGGTSGITTSGGVTTIDFNPEGSIHSVSGSFGEVGTCLDCVNLASQLSSNTSMSMSTPFELFNASNNGESVTFSLNSATFMESLGAYIVSGSGTATLSNYTATSGSYTLSVDSANSGASFDFYSSVPEPGTLALFGAGLLGFAVFVGRRRRATKPLA